VEIDLLQVPSKNRLIRSSISALRRPKRMRLVATRRCVLDRRGGGATSRSTAETSAGSGSSKSTITPSVTAIRSIASEQSVSISRGNSPRWRSGVLQTVVVLYCSSCCLSFFLQQPGDAAFLRDRQPRSRLDTRRGTFLFVTWPTFRPADDVGTIVVP
jgi:hypothetical protein